jgi:hypothetical protein
MGYSIYVGNVVLEYVNEEGEAYCRPAVEAVKRDDAPWWPSPPDAVMSDASGHTNCRMPAYGVWPETIREVGGRFERMWLDPDEGVLRDHPGCVPINRWHVEVAEEAVASWRERHPGTEPGWGKGQDAVLAKLIWYAWWFRWAVENCERPGVQNT